MFFAFLVTKFVSLMEQVLLVYSKGILDLNPSSHLFSFSFATLFVTHCFYIVHFLDADLLSTFSGVVYLLLPYSVLFVQRKSCTLVCLFLTCSPFSCLQGTGEPFRRAEGQRCGEQRAPWRVNPGPLLPQPAVLGPLPLPPPPPPAQPAPQLSAVVVPLTPTPLLLLPPPPAAVMETQAVLPAAARQQEDRHCLRYPFTAEYLTAKQSR